MQHLHEAVPLFLAHLRSRQTPTNTVEANAHGLPHFVQAITPLGLKREQGSVSTSNIRLWLCLLLALLVRVWLVVHTHGVIVGDEALVGIQAQQILHGEHPIYYYAQPYMGSLEAYLIALLFAIAGSSVWTLRAEPILLSLVLVWLTWKLAGALAEAAHLPPSAQQRFMTIAALLVAVPPLYDGVVELRTLGGYIETFVLMLLLLLSALRLTQRWHSGASAKELASRWAGIGFLIGLGFWVNPLIISAVLAVTVWIIGYCIAEMVKVRWHPTKGSRQPVVSTVKGLVLAISAIPTSLIGFAPGLRWGATHHWENITFLLSHGADLLHDPKLQLHYHNRFEVVLGMLHFYGTCMTPRIIGGVLPNTTLSPLSFFALGIDVLCILATFTLITLSFFWHAQPLLYIRRLAALPLLFGTCTAFIVCTSNISMLGLLHPCDRDDVGRYAAPLVLALPFFASIIFTLAHIYFVEKGKGHPQDVEGERIFSQSLFSQVLAHLRLSRMMHTILLALLLLYLCIYGYTYVKANAGSTFQSNYCPIAPAANDPIIVYLQHEHVHYAWANFWIGEPIIFKTNGNILTADPRTAKTNLNRIPAHIDAIIHAKYPSILVFVSHNDPYPQLLRKLDARHITYHVARFPSEPGFDVLVVTSLSRTVSPFEANNLGASFGSC